MKPWKYERDFHDRVFNAVVVKVREARQVCSRCQEELEGWSLLRHDVINSFSASEETWDALEEHGETVATSSSHQEVSA